MPYANQLNIKYEGPQCGAFSISKTSWIKYGSKQPLPVKELKPTMTQNKLATDQKVSSAQTIKQFWISKAKTDTRNENITAFSTLMGFALP